MKYLVITLLLIVSNASARDVYVQPHVTKNGTFVQGHYRTAPDNNPYNNYSTQGNTNQYTGAKGTQSPQNCLRDYQGNCM